MEQSVNPPVETVDIVAEPTLPDPDLRVMGNHHLAFISENMEATHRFWTETLGLRFSWAITNLYIPSTGQYSPHMHTFYELGKRGNVAYFAIHRETLDPGPNWADSPARFIALEAGSPGQLEGWKRRLQDAGVAVREDTEEDGRPALAFRDPEGHLFKITPPAREYSGDDREKAHSLVQAWIAEERAAKSA